MDNQSIPNEDCTQDVGGNYKETMFPPPRVPSAKRPVKIKTKTEEDIFVEKYDKLYNEEYDDDGCRHRNWVFTAFDMKPPQVEERLQYMVYQEELCPRTKRPHLQGYIQFKNPIGFSGVRKIHGHCYWAKREGTHEQAKRYCMKNASRINGPWESGTEKDDQGKRMDLEELKEDLISDMPALELANKHFMTYIRYNRGINEYKKLRFNIRSSEPEVWLITGPSGCGKTRYVYDKHGFNGVYSVNNKDWWDNYTQHRVILFDEVDSKDYTKKQWCEMLDRYPYQVPVKGGFVHLNSPIIYLINSDPWQLKFFEMGDLKRRVTGKITFDKNGTPGVEDYRLKSGVPAPPPPVAGNLAGPSQEEIENKHDDEDFRPVKLTDQMNACGILVTPEPKRKCVKETPPQVKEICAKIKKNLTYLQQRDMSQIRIQRNLKKRIRDPKAAVVLAETAVSEVGIVVTGSEQSVIPVSNDDPNDFGEMP